MRTPARVQRVWELAGAPQRLTIDLDATLINAHSEEDEAAGTFARAATDSRRCWPMVMRLVRRSRASCAPGTPGANNAADQIEVAEQAVAQIPAEHVETIEIMLRVDSAGASHELFDWCREGKIEFSVGYDLTRNCPRSDPGRSARTTGSAHWIKTETRATERRRSMR